MNEKTNECPLVFKLSYWWAFGMATVFLLYGGVNIVLSFLDHNFKDISQSIIFLLLGILLLIVAYAYKGLKPWGWYAQIVINGLIVLGASIGFGHYENIILLILAAGALVSLFSSETKAHLAGTR
ncbi:MAG: hypothetical protein KOO62_10715 [candidate division Zixibacteria bacterium]|nr:hypothetical protein [candidate division Zixibacteria bacterium]